MAPVQLIRPGHLALEGLTAVDRRTSYRPHQGRDTDTVQGYCLVEATCKVCA